MTLEEFIQKKREEFDKKFYSLDESGWGGGVIVSEDGNEDYNLFDVSEFIEQAIREAWNQEFKQMVDRAAVNSAELQKQLLDNSDLVEKNI